MHRIVQTVGPTFVVCGITALSFTDVSRAEEAGKPGLEEVIVTARRTEERLQDIPLTITALSSEALQARGIENVQDLNSAVPGLSIVPANSPATLVLNIRGLGNFQPNGGSDAAVGFYVNDVPINLQVGTNIGMFDLENVQVLKGPQGTLFGRNTTGGAILVNSKKPSDRFEGYLQGGGTFFEAGSGWQAEGAVNLPIADTLALRLAATTEDRDGWIKNIIDPNLGPAVYGYPWPFGQTKFNNLMGVNSQGYRGSLLWNVTSDIENLTVYGRGEYRGTPNVPRSDALNPVGPIAQLAPLFGVPDQNAALQRIQSARYWWSTMAVANNPLTVHDTTVSNTTTWKINAALTLKNIFGYKKVDELYGQDITGLPGPWYNYAIRDGGTDYSDELQMQGLAMDGKFKWVAGAFHFHERFFNHSYGAISFGTTGSESDFNSTSRSDSLFAQATFEIPAVTGLSITAGARYTKDEKDATDRRLSSSTTCVFPGKTLADCLLTGSADFTRTTYTASIDYKWDADSLVYFTTRSGYRAGGFSQTANDQTGFAPFQPEKLIDNELGLKKDWMLGNVAARSNLAVFYQNYKDIQRLIADPADFTNQYIVNAATATVKGAEIDLTVQPIERLQIEYSFSYIDPRYDKFISGGTDFSGGTFAFAPHRTHNLALGYTFLTDPHIGEASIHGQYHHQSEMFMDDEKQSTAFGPRDSLVAEAYGVLDLGLDLKRIAGSNVDLNVFMKNATNEKIASGGAPLYQSLGTILHFYTVPPRMTGFNLRYNFGSEAR